MEQDIAIGVGLGAKGMGNGHPAQPEFPPRNKPVDIIALTDSKSRHTVH
jgi:hypothetical protein